MNEEAIAPDLEETSISEFEDDENDLDGCEVSSGDETRDDELPAAEGGVG